MSYLIDPFRFDSDAAAYFAAMTVQPDDTFKSAITGFVRGLKEDQIWDKFEAIYFAANAEQSSFINLRRPSLFTITKNGAGTFTAYRGWAGNTATGSYLSLNYSPNTQAINWSQNSASMGFYINQHGTLVNHRFLSVTSITGPDQLSLAPYVSGNITARINSQTISSYNVPVANRLGWRAISRVSASESTVYSNATSLLISTTSDGITTDGPVATGSPRNGNYVDDRAPFIFLAGGMTPTEMEKLRLRVNTALTAIGAA